MKDQPNPTMHQTQREIACSAYTVAARLERILRHLRGTHPQAEDEKKGYEDHIMFQQERATQALAQCMGMLSEIENILGTVEWDCEQPKTDEEVCKDKNFPHVTGYVRRM